MSGVNTTNSPVMNAEFDVRRALRGPRSGTSSRRSRRRRTRAPRARSRARVRRRSPGRRQPRRSANGSSTIAPIENRNRMKPTGVTSSSAFCTSLNVRAVRDRRRDQRELGQRAAARSPTCAGRRAHGIGPRSAGPAIGDREAAILAERLAATPARRAAPAGACTRCDRPSARRAARARRRSRARSSSATDRSPST